MNFSNADSMGNMGFYGLTSLDGILDGGHNADRRAGGAGGTSAAAQDLRRRALAFGFAAPK